MIDASENDVPNPRKQGRSNSAMVTLGGLISGYPQLRTHKSG